MVATNLVPVVPSEVFAKNRYVFRQVREEMAAIQYGDRQFWGKPYLALQVYGRMLGSMVFDAVTGKFNVSRLPTLTDLLRTMLVVSAGCGGGGGRGCARASARVRRLTHVCRPVLTCGCA